MKTKLLLTTALVATAFMSNAFAEDLNIGTGISQTVSANASYDGATINGGRLEIGSPVGSHLNISVIGNVTITAPTAPGDMGDGWEEQLLINESTLSADNITASGNTGVDRSGGIRLLNSTLIADTVSVSNADITVMGGTGNDGNTFILAGKSYNSNNDYSNSYLRANVVSLSSEGNYGIGDDRINFIVEDDVTLNISGEAGMSAGSLQIKKVAV